MHRCRLSLGLLAALAFAGATGAAAEVQVEGSPPALRVTTSRDAIADVLSALGGSFNVRYRTAVSLDAAADPAYSGSVRQVISRLLDGYDYVVKTERDETEVVVFGRRGAAAILPPAAKASASSGLLSRWR